LYKGIFIFIQDKDAGHTACFSRVGSYTGAGMKDAGQAEKNEMADDYKGDMGIFRLQTRDNER
jgi:hypothetical protein